MTEDEARTKWCPFSRVDQTHIAPNRNSYSHEIMGGAHCIASACMAWRWDIILPEGTEPQPLRSSTVDGNCGLRR